MASPALRFITGAPLRKSLTLPVTVATLPTGALAGDCAADAGAGCGAVGCGAARGWLEGGGAGCAVVAGAAGGAGVCEAGASGSGAFWAWAPKPMPSTAVNAMTTLARAALPTLHGDRADKAGCSADHQKCRPNHDGGAAGQLGDLATVGRAANQRATRDADRMQDCGRCDKPKTKLDA